MKPVVTAVIVEKLELQTGDFSRKFSFCKLQVLRRIEVVWKGITEPLHILDVESSNSAELMSVTSVFRETLSKLRLSI